MKKRIIYLLFIFTGFFWGCLDFDRIIEYRETLYGGCCEYGSEVELRRAASSDNNNSEFEKNSLFVSSDTDFFLYQNPESYWDHTLSFSEMGITGDINVSPDGSIIAAASKGTDSVAASLTFYTVSAGLPIKLERDLEISKESDHEYVQEFKLLIADHLSLLLRDDSLRTNRIKLLRLNSAGEWENLNGNTSDQYDLRMNDAEPIEQFQSFWYFGDQDIQVRVLTIDSEKLFKFYEAEGSNWREPGLNSYSGIQTLPDSLRANTVHLNGNSLFINRIESESTFLEEYYYDTFQSAFIKRDRSVAGETTFLQKTSKIQHIIYERQDFLILGNTEDSTKGIEASLRLYELFPDELSDGIWKLRETLTGTDQFAVDFDVNIDASTLAIGEPSNDFISRNAGAVQIYDISLNELLINMDQELDITTDTNIHTGTKLHWSHIGWDKALGDNITYRIYRKIWESGQKYELIGESTESASRQYEYIDHTAYEDTNYVYVVVPYDRTTNEEGDWKYQVANNSIITRPVNPMFSPRYYEGSSKSKAFEVYVNSGSLRTQYYNGEFSYTKPEGSDDFTGSIWVDTLIFDYRDSLLTSTDMDYHPYVFYENNAFRGIYMVGGASDKRFGFNDGFRSFPEFQPFGYLNADQGIEGFGTVSYAEISTDLEREQGLPSTLALSQNYPNPFNPSTNISFTLPAASQVQLKVYNLLGQQVASLVDRRMGQGTHSVNFDASDLSTGLYVYRLVAGNTAITKKMLLTK